MYNKCKQEFIRFQLGPDMCAYIIYSISYTLLIKSFFNRN